MVGQIRVAFVLVVLQLKWAGAAQCRELPADSGKLPHIICKAAYCRRTLPFLPAGFIVLAVGVVIAALAVGAFIPHPEHGHALGQKHNGKGVLYLPLAQLVHLPVPANALLPAVPAEIPIYAVLVVFPVLLIMLVLIKP